MRKQCGFSLIELLIVVAIIMILAAIAIPTLFRARIDANQAAAVQDIRAINTSEIAYTTTYPDAGYAILPKLGNDPSNCTAAGISNSQFACLINFKRCLAIGICSNDKYNFLVTVPGPTDYIAGAVPVDPSSGQQDVCSLPDGAVRVKADTNSNGTGFVTSDNQCDGNGFSPLGG